MAPRRFMKLYGTCILLCVVLFNLLIQYTTLEKTSTLYILKRGDDRIEEYSENTFQEQRRSGSNSHYIGSTTNAPIEDTCPGMIFPEQNNRDETWHQVDNEKKIFVVSAYYIKSKNMVFIIGAKPMYDVSVICQIWSTGNGNADVNVWQSKAKVGTPNDWAGPLPYTAAIFNCPVVNSTVTPTHVSLVTKSCESARNILQVRIVPEGAPFQRRFTVCMAPIYSYGAAHQLVEWIELNKILGIEKFVIYNHSTTANVDRVIDYYSKRGLAEVIQWPIPFPILHHIHYFGQTVALNDCLFRNKYVSEYISNIDKDEFIIPRSEEAADWSQMISNLNRYADTYMFRNVIFRKEWINMKRSPEAEALHLLTAKHVERETKIWNTGDRSKYIARAAKVWFLWMHSVRGSNTFTAPITDGLLHHFRSWEKYDDKIKRVLDLTISERFGDLLIKNVRNVWNDLAKTGVNMSIVSDL